MYFVLLFLFLVNAFSINAAGVERACGQRCDAQTAMAKQKCGQDSGCKAIADIKQEDCVKNCSFIGDSSDCLRHCEAQGQQEICTHASCRLQQQQRINDCKRGCHVQTSLMTGQDVSYMALARTSPCLMQCMASFQQQKAFCRDQNCVNGLQMQSQQCPSFCQAQQQHMMPPRPMYNGGGYMPQ